MPKTHPSTINDAIEINASLGITSSPFIAISVWLGCLSFAPTNVEYGIILTVHAVLASGQLFLSSGID
jgi:hypothetical protein